MLRKRFRTATSETHFTFNSSIFNQIDGVAIGSPLALVLANLFTGFHEQNWIERATNVKPVFYKRCVDDNTESEIKIRYFKLHFIGLHSKLTQKKVDQLCKRSCKSLKVQLIFTNEKLRCAFSTKDPNQSEHLSKVVYKFLCASCNASYADI